MLVTARKLVGLGLTFKTTGHIICSMSKRDAKKEQILWAGLELMKIHGYNGTSVKDIVDAAGVPKGSFYNYFASKESFALEALDAVAEHERRIAAELLDCKIGSPLTRLHNFFDQISRGYAAEEFRVGCFCCNLGQELADCNDVIRRKVEQILNAKSRMIADVLDEALASGEIDKGESTENLADFLFNAWEGTLARMKTSKNREPLNIFLEMLPRIAGKFY